MASVSKASKEFTHHGQHVFIYSNLRTNQILYSLNRVMSNKQAIEQLPFLGSQTRPKTLRKDLWQPLATVTFPTSHQGLLAYRKLREFNKRHYHEWDPFDTSGRTTQLKAREVRDQKANSVADLACVLLGQEQTAKQHSEEAARDLDLARTVTTETHARIELLSRTMKTEELKQRELHNSSPDASVADHVKMTERYKALKSEKMLLNKKLRKEIAWRALLGQSHPFNMSPKAPKPKYGPKTSKGCRILPRLTMDGLRIEWKDILDAEYAETWPKSVTHYPMLRNGQTLRNVAPVPSSPQVLHSYPLDDVAVQTLIRNGSEMTLASGSTAEPPNTMQALITRLAEGK